MRNIHPELAQKLSSGVFLTCLCWRFSRIDGRVFGATDHDRRLEFDGVIYHPDSALRAGDFSANADLAPGQVSGIGGIGSGFLTESDLDNGVWNSARIDVFRVDWSDPALRVQIWSGRLGEVSREGTCFRAELLSLKADLERQIGRVYTRTCDAEIGDARCGVDLQRPEYSGQGRVSAILSERSFATFDLGDYADGWFGRGRLFWTSGSLSGGRMRIASHIRRQSRSELELIGPMSSPVQIGDAFTVSVGCDKTLSTCRDKFANIINFRGFPYLPGNDVLLAGPAGDGRDNGGSR